ncbi:hypothetical protein CLIB1444_02S11914 [[Candida] jaroonii]|uniref:Uncharacterized protein n=1 Tax=[Candida] jaroonii TaxID=467808 RepID=A0ACA9Y5C1_9ASCO|nr:hypothetical protein CLIB1444_02S11914 [[Candida] jaroonii]
MPDLFDNFFGKINHAVSGKTPTHYGLSSQVNSGRYYSYHTNSTNNNYWMPRDDKIKVMKQDHEDKMNPEMQTPRPRMGSDASDMERKGSVSSQASD